MAALSITFQHGARAALPDFTLPFPPADLASALSPSLSLAGFAFTLFSAVSAFIATNLDDILLLLLFFSQITNRRGALAVVGGQYLGLGLLVLVSLSGLLGRAFVPGPWLGLLGLLPISLAVSRWLEAGPGGPAAAQPSDGAADPLAPPPAALAVAALTLANGSDNVGVYLPLFARANPAQALLTLAVFAVMVALWCAIAWRLVQAPGLGDGLRRHGPRWMPAVLVGLGLYLLIDAHTFAHRGLALLALLGLAALAAPLARWAPSALGLFPVPSSRLPSP
jgi:cadmium resistance protein CadD (predicted permease)